MAIKAEVTTYLKSFTADVEFTDIDMSFYGPGWEIGLFFGLIPIKGKVKELMRIAYDQIAEITVGRASRLVKKTDVCVLKLQNGTQMEVAFIPFESGRAMLYEKAADKFV